MQSSTHRKIQNFSYIVVRNVLPLTNWVIAAVVGMLFFFQDTQAGIFLGAVLCINITLGLAQDIRAWIALENLELLMAPRITRLSLDNTETSILTEEIQKGDLLKIKTGDQIPCDGTLIETKTFEVNEGLITGESSSLPKPVGSLVLAGSIVTAGTALLRAETVFHESRIARMTEGIKSYAINQSPIQESVGEVIRYSGYILVLMILFVIGRGLLMHTPQLIVVKNIGALASMIVPQGLSFAITLLFAYGAAHLYRKHILLQEVNATEKLGRIHNLCMDKTGTLSENRLVVEEMLLAKGIDLNDAQNAITAYVSGLGDATESVTAIGQFLSHTFIGTIRGAIPFSSWRQYGAVRFEDTEGSQPVVVAGALDRILPHLAQDSDRLWLQHILSSDTYKSKRLLCFAINKHSELPLDLEHTSLSLVAVFVFHHQMRPGVREAIDFFQQRGVHIRIISGDHPETVRAVALEAGVKNCDRSMTGSDMDHWSSDEKELERRIQDTTIFARIVPEQKELIIEILKRDGFTAMVGDGANDALAIKKADLGIAMFEGAPATRQLASIVLTHNSFTDLPKGVELADSIIKNAEIFAAIFFDMAFAGFFFFITISSLGYPFPLTPLNITLINYFTVGLPGLLVSYWTIRPSEKTAPASTKKLLRSVLPFVIGSALLQSFAMSAVFTLQPETTSNIPSNFLVVLTAIITGFVFFLLSPLVYRHTILPEHTKALQLLTIFEGILFIALLQIPFCLRFFEIDPSEVSLDTIIPFLGIIGIYMLLQYAFSRLLTDAFQRSGNKN